MMKKRKKQMMSLQGKLCLHNFAMNTCRFFAGCRPIYMIIVEFLFLFFFWSRRGAFVFDFVSTKVKT